MNESEASNLAQTAVHLLSNYYQSRAEIAQFRQQMVQSFDEGELRSLCFDLQINYDSLPGSGTGDKTREIITLCLRQARLRELWAYCQQARPHAFAELNVPEEDTAVADFLTAEKLSARLTETTRADPYAGQSLARLADQPESNLRQTALASLLTEMIGNDEALGALVQQTLGQAAVGDHISQEVNLSDSAQAGDINMIGKIEGNVPKAAFNKEKKKKRWWHGLVPGSDE